MVAHNSYKLINLWSSSIIELEFRNSTKNSWVNLFQNRKFKKRSFISESMSFQLLVNVPVICCKSRDTVFILVI
jgi:hypothetical protein